MAKVNSSIEARLQGPKASDKNIVGHERFPSGLIAVTGFEISPPFREGLSPVRNRGEFHFCQVVDEGKRATGQHVVSQAALNE